MTARAPMLAPSSMTTYGPMLAPSPIRTFRPMMAVGCTPGAWRIGGGAKRSTTLEKASVGFSQRISAGGTSSPKDSGTRATVALVARSWGRYLGFPKKVTSPGCASARAAAPQTFNDPSTPDASRPPTRSANSERVISTAGAYLGFASAGLSVVALLGRSAFNLSTTSLVKS